ncbi:hypothetical protein ORI89_07530 [Sphingobacterium sp. UT-1RO-CII-1]|uniref:hypothetical protein n=1 Tax=Sphingobacterium sp. UT-1RO-CII-1 TaxID=2995225 RepID=UPI00227BE602|nr:hypothetical protein [Sphingobacterium sp. UT-1RO-CII-1]MCY4779496.1 hypothetical protein [Sphingobacterium sp. UT-1RO-CII-1]
MAYKLKAKVLISKKPTCNCGGFYHPGEVFEESNEQKAKRYIAKGWVEVLSEPTDVKEAKAPVKTKELKTATKTK